MAARVLAVVNQKGGAGKTSVSYHVACQAVMEGYKTLLIDCDQQFSAALQWGVEAEELLALDAQRKTLLDALLEQKDERVPLRDMILRREGRPDFVPSSARLGRAPKILLLAAERALKRALNIPADGVSIADAYDLIVLDTPGNVGLMVSNALAAATDVLVPVQPQHLSYSAMLETLRSIMEIKDVINHEMVIAGFLPTLVTSQTHDRVVLDAIERLAVEYQVPMFPAIPNAAAYKKVTTCHAPVMEFAPATKGVEAFRAVVGHVMRGEAA